MCRLQKRSQTRQNNLIYIFRRRDILEKHVYHISPISPTLKFTLGIIQIQKRKTEYKFHLQQIITD